jgi:hypothetical protein
MLGTKLERALGRVVQVALASSLGMTAHACTGGPALSSAADGGGANSAGPDATIDGPPFADDENTFACEAPLPPMLANLTPATPVDYAELRQEVPVEPYGDDTKMDRSTVETHGTLCATATDASACTAAVDAVTIGENGWRFDGDHINLGRRPGHQALVVTRGDEVSVLRSEDDLRGFLGSIDTVEEARLLLLATNNPFTCTTDPAREGWRKNPDGSFEFLVAGRQCGSMIPYRRRYVVGKDGSVGFVASDPPLVDSMRVCGRRPAGLAPARPMLACSALGAHFAQAAHLESASVIAFRRLECELVRLGAPRSLVTRARRSRSEEIHHARETARLARRFRADVPPVEVVPFIERSLFDIALENAVEGCVGETYGALVAAFQAERALPELRPLMRRIARDEARHAELAHDVARWLEPRLSRAERAEIAHARGAARANLHGAVQRGPELDAEVVRVAGMPTRAEALILVGGLDEVVAAA